MSCSICNGYPGCPCCSEDEDEDIIDMYDDFKYSEEDDKDDE